MCFKLEDSWSVDLLLWKFNTDKILRVSLMHVPKLMPINKHDFTLNLNVTRLFLTSWQSANCYTNYYALHQLKFYDRLYKNRKTTLVQKKDSNHLPLSHSTRVKSISLLFLHQTRLSPLFPLNLVSICQIPHSCRTGLTN